MDAKARRLAKDLSALMRRNGSAAAQIASMLMQRCDINPRVAFRYALGLSQSQVADRYNQQWPGGTPKTYKQISYWERWRGPGFARSSSARAPSLEDLGRLAILYGCLVDDLLYGPRHAATPPMIAVPYEVIADVLAALESPARSALIDHTDNDAMVALRTCVGEGTVIVTMSRRKFSAMLATGSLATLLPDTVLAPAAAETSSAVASFQRILAAHQDGHYLLSPSAHIASLTDTLRDITASRDGASIQLRRDLRGVQAEIAEHLSWLHRETADIVGCRRWADRATSWALEAGDTTMATYMMLRTATLALDHGDFPRTIELAQAAQHTPWTNPPVLQAVALLYQARGHAGTGTIAAAPLDSADELLAAAPGQDNPAYLRFYGRKFGELQRATCYVAAGRPALAVTILQAQLNSLPATHHRDRAVQLARLGVAHAIDQTPDAAAIAGMASLAEARRSGSQRAVAELMPLRGMLNRRWPTQSKVREFHAALAAS
jgi:hypothetical protein